MTPSPAPDRFADDPSDRGLVRAFLADRDDDAFLALYRRHTPALYGMALRLAGRGNAGSQWAEEVVADAWGRAVPRLDGFEWRSGLRTWLIGIVVNCHREAVRRARGSTVTIPLEERHGTASTARPDLGLDLDAALSRLPDGFREVVVLYHMYGFRHHEIAECLGISVGTSKSQLARGLARLRTMLD